MAARLVGRWWNGSWGTWTRRDIWLFEDGARWRVRARDGGENGRDLTWPLFAKEYEARALVERLISTAPGPAGQWKDITSLVNRPPPSGREAET